MYGRVGRQSRVCVYTYGKMCKHDIVFTHLCFHSLFLYLRDALLLNSIFDLI